jgi:7 transmembrane receptor (rhodopsin family)
MIFADSLDFENSTTEGNDSNTTILNETSHTTWVLGNSISILLILDAAITSIWSLVANCMILVAVLVDPHLQHNAYVYGVSLALADLIGTINLGFGSYSLLYGSWPIQNAGLCKFWTALDYTTGLLGSLSIALISFDRYKMVKHPEKYLREETTKKAVMRSLVVWLFSFIFYVPATVFWDIVVGYSVIPVDECDPEFRDVAWMTVIQSVVEFFLPLCVIFFCNVSLILYMREQTKRNKGLQFNLQSVQEDDILDLSSAVGKTLQ